MTILSTLPATVSIPHLSGERFTVRYAVTGNEREATQKAEDICLEQTVEFPADLLPAGDIQKHLVGRVEKFEKINDNSFQVDVSFALECAGEELPQLLNVIFGNISIRPGIRVLQLFLPEHLLMHYRGPRFGQDKLRDFLGVHDRPLLMTALKPMGLSNQHLAELAYNFALAGVDIIKDDHGLSNQSLTPFEERVELCAAAVARANKEAGHKSIYMPNVTAPAADMHARARMAKAAGAGGLLVCPGITGFDAMRLLADDDEIALPIASHPALTGSFVTSPDNGMSHYLLYGQLQRLAGADSSIYPNFGGRFSFSVEECKAIAAGCMDVFGNLAPAFPTPGGGIHLENIPQLRQVYGPNIMYLIGGGLHRGGGTLKERVSTLLKSISRISANAGN